MQNNFAVLVYNPVRTNIRYLIDLFLPRCEEKEFSSGSSGRVCLPALLHYKVRPESECDDDFDCGYDSSTHEWRSCRDGWQGKRCELKQV